MIDSRDAMLLRFNSLATRLGWKPLRRRDVDGLVRRHGERGAIVLARRVERALEFGLTPQSLSDHHLERVERRICVVVGGSVTLADHAPAPEGEAVVLLRERMRNPRLRAWEKSPRGVRP